MTPVLLAQADVWRLGLWGAIDAWCRDNDLGAEGWTAVADALEELTSLTSLNRCDKYRAIRAGGLAELDLGNTQLGVAMARYLHASTATLKTLDLRCSGSTIILHLDSTYVKAWDRFTFQLPCLTCP